MVAVAETIAGTGLGASAGADTAARADPTCISEHPPTIHELAPCTLRSYIPPFSFSFSFQVPHFFSSRFFWGGGGYIDLLNCQPNSTQIAFQIRSALWSFSRDFKSGK